MRARFTKPGALGTMLALPLLLAACLKSGTVGDTSVRQGDASFDSEATTGPQASLTLACGATGLCNATNTEWSLVKTGQINALQVQWTIGALHGEESHAIVSYTGALTVTNTGSADATIGNILVNLQRKSGKNMITAASVMADSTSGDNATRANICSSASSEGKSYFLRSSSAVGLEFRDADDNTVFSLVPQKLLSPGQTVNLTFTAKFDATALNLPASEQVRFEAIVSFGNAGGRGGSGAVCGKIDASGDGLVSADETYVRSVPCRTTVLIPALERSNASVALSDDGSEVTSDGTLSLANYLTDIGGGTGVESTSLSIGRTAQLDVDPGTDGGTVTNCARLAADVIPACNPPVALRACDSQHFAGIPIGFSNGNFCTYTQGGWGAKPAGKNPGMILSSNFSTVYPGGSVEIGLPGQAGYSMIFKSAAAIDKYLPAGSTPKALTADLVNPSSSASGVFGGQMTALRLNLDFNAKGITAGTDGMLGGLLLRDTGTSLDGLTLWDVYTAGSKALGGAGLPSDMSYSSMSDMATRINEAFDGCTVSDWAQKHLRRP